MTPRLASYLRRLNGKLFWCDINLLDLAEEFGTPLLIYSAERFRNNLAWLHDGLTSSGQPFQIAYALKACSHSAIASIALKAGTWAEVMSLWEYRLARQVGFTPQQVIINGIGWNDDLIERAISDEAALINIDNEIDLRRVAMLARHLGKNVSIGIRIIPDLDGLFTPQQGKLGSPVRSGEAGDLLRKALQFSNLRCIAVSTHGCHRLSDPSCIAKIGYSVAQFVLEQRRASGLQLRILDFGGGFDDRAVIEQAGWSATDFCEPLAQAARLLGRDIQLLIEPGRFVVGDAGIVLTKVRVVKTSGGKSWLIVDIGTNILIPISSAHYEGHLVDDSGGKRQLYSLADGICSPTSIIQEDVWLSENVQPGTLLAITYAGSYTLALAENWAYPLPKTILMDEGGPKVILTEESAQRMFFESQGCLRE